MSKQRLIWLAATLFSLAIVLVTTSPTRPGDNKDGGD
jgi:hypothetical protein